MCEEVPKNFPIATPLRNTEENRWRVPKEVISTDGANVLIFSGSMGVKMSGCKPTKLGHGTTTGDRCLYDGTVKSYC